LQLEKGRGGEVSGFEIPVAVSTKSTQSGAEREAKLRNFSLLLGLATFGEHPSTSLMSSVTRSTQQQSSDITPKKKFGKNLNKLTKPPAPPVPSSAKANASSRNGLLLLSTKRLSSASNAAASSGGILASRPSPAAAKPLPSLGLQYDSNPSTHDALLGAVVGASRAEAQQPDAWGVAENQHKGSEVKLGAADVNGPQDAPVSNNRVEANTDHGAAVDRHGTASNQYNELPTSNWDEYGGRSLPVNGDVHTPEKDGDDQKAAMSLKARERAEKRREEEEAREKAQRLRAAQRLRDLEQKMASERPSADVSSQPELDVGVPKPELHLERLGRAQSMPEQHHRHQSSTPSADRSATQRTLYDPNRTYSSLVGGDASSGDKDARSATPEASNRNGRMGGGAYKPEPQSYHDSRDPYSRQPVIQLSSYEDRDRGERGASAGPRMLYDPKSGSMVAVPSRDEAASGGRGRKERGKKGRNSRDKDVKGDSRLDSDGGKGGRKGKRRDEKKATNDSVSPAKVDAKKGKVLNERKFSRTCGVLYARDNKGNFHCADGCDGDLGYGAHSVPGGRTKNPEAYAKFVQDQKQMHQEDMSMYDNPHLETSYETDGLLQDGAHAVTLHTGFSVSEPQEVKMDWLKPNEKIELITGIDDSPTLQATAKEWAPSHSAIAAAAASAKDMPVLPSSVDSVDSDDEDDDDAPVSAYNSFHSSVAVVCHI
jgi:hypothetical protein